MKSSPVAVTSSVNQNVQALVEALLRRRADLGVEASEGPFGVCLVDAGLDARGSAAAGRRIAEIAMGGLGSVRLVGGRDWPTWVEVHSHRPVLACLGSQYAGWSLSATKEQTGGRKFQALGSGPVRALACKEALLADLGIRDQASTSALLLEADRFPPEVVLAKVLADSGLAGEGLTVIVTPTTSLAGTTQIVARVLEVAMHKAHELGFALADVVEGMAWAPLPAPASDMVEAMGRTNDAILFGGRVHLTVAGDEAAARALAHDLPSRNSRDYGRPFAQVFREAEFDFYKIDPALFAPAEVWVSHLGSGRTWRAGSTDVDLLKGQWLAPDEA